MHYTTQVHLLQINVTKVISTSPVDDGGWSTSDSLSLFAIIISVLSVVISYYTVYKSKHLEIRYAAFEKLGIDNIYKMFEPIDVIFKDKINDDISIHINAITDYFTDIDLYLVQFKDTYTNMEIQKVINIKEDFTDMLYLASHRKIGDYKIQYLATKSKMMHELYVYALENNQLLIWEFWNYLFKRK